MEAFFSISEQDLKCPSSPSFWCLTTFGRTMEEDKWSDPVCVHFVYSNYLQQSIHEEWDPCA